MGCVSSSPKAGETPPPASVPWKGVWKEISASASDSDSSKSVKGPLQMKLGRHTQAYMKRTMEVNFGTAGRIQVVTGPILLLKESNTETLLGLAERVGQNYVVYRPQPFYWGQPSSGKHQGAPYYLYATMKPGGTVLFNDPHKTLGLEPFRLHNGPRNSFEKYCQKAGKPHPFAQWKYNAAEKLHHITVRGSGCDIGLILLLVVIGDLRDTDATMNKLGESVVQASAITASAGAGIGSALAG